MGNFYQFLDTVGDGSGTVDITGDYSSTAERFLIANPSDSDEVMYVNRLIIHYGDTAGFSADAFADFVSALTNGIQVRHRNDFDDSILEDLTDGEPIKSNAEWAKFCYDGRVDAFGSGADYFVVRWTLAGAGKPLALRPGQSLNFEFNDDMSGLLGMTVQAQGYKV